MRQVKMLLVAVGLLYLSFTVDAALCPNSRDSCPSWTTCCVLIDGTYGCCPYKNARCCVDRIHCCPSDTTCNMKRGACDSRSYGSIPFDWMVSLYKGATKASKLAAKTRLNEESSLEKVNEESNLEKVNEESNLEKASGPMAVEFKDSGFTKDLSVAINCPDRHTCPNGTSCCEMPLGNYGCCRYTEANCCTDKQHCCPRDYNCDLQNNRCRKKTLAPRSSLWSSLFYVAEESQVAIYNLVTEQFEEAAEDMACSETNFCSLGGFICCSSEGSNYCCPPGTLCSKDGKLCQNKYSEFSVWNLNSLNFFESSQKPLKEKESVGIVCPDRTESCPDGNTCCKMVEGMYGCCPYPKATCCAGSDFCCPHGYACTDYGCERKPYIHLFEKPEFVNKSPVS